MQLTRALAKAMSSTFGFSDNFPPNYFDAF